MKKLLISILILAITHSLRSAVKTPLLTDALTQPRSAHAFYTIIDNTQPEKYDTLYFQFSSNSTFDGLGTFIAAVPYKTTSYEYSIPTPNHEYNKNYYVRLAGKVGAEISPWSSGKLYNTNMNLYCTTYGTSTDKAFNGIKLDCSSLSGINDYSYELQSDTNVSFGSPALMKHVQSYTKISGNRFNFPILLQPGEKRYFRVRPYKNNSQGTWSNVISRANIDNSDLRFLNPPQGYEFKIGVVYNQLLEEYAKADTSYHYVLVRDTTPNFNSPALSSIRLSGTTIFTYLDLVPFVKNYITCYLTNNITRAYFTDTLITQGTWKSIKPQFLLTDERLRFNNINTLTRIYLEFDTTLLFNSGAKLVDSIINNIGASIFDYNTTDFTKYGRMYLRTKSGNSSILFDWDTYDTVRFDRPGIYMPVKTDTTSLFPSFKPIPLKNVGKYESEFDITPSFNSPYKKRISHTNSSTLNFGKSTYNRPYYLRTRAVSGSIYSDWSNPIRFQPTINSTIVGAIYLNIPYSIKNFTYGLKSGSKYAHFQLSNDTFFTNPYSFSECLTTGEPDIFLKVMSVHSSKWVRMSQSHEWDTSNWSKPFKIYLSPLGFYPEVAPYTYPENCQTVPGGLTTFRWRKNPSVDFYKLQIDLKEATFLEDFAWTGDTFIQLPLAANRSYRYKIITAKNGVKDLSISPTYYFNTVDGTLGYVHENTETLTLYPNPVRDILTIEKPTHVNCSQAEIEILNTMGKLLLKTTVTSESASINTAELPNGLYFVRMQFNGVSSVQKLIVEH